MLSPKPTRRSLLRTGIAAGVTVFAPRIVFAAAPTARRFVFVIQRGAADGLGLLAPVGDPAYAGVRGALGEQDGSKLDGFFALHPRMPLAAGMYAAGEALFAHAVASPYRDRSHFDGQNVLETGGTAAFQRQDGWLNRLLTLLPRDRAEAVAVSSTMPMALRGPAEVGSYAPSVLPDASDDLLARVTTLYGGDAQLHALWTEAMETRALTGDAAAAGAGNAAATGTLAARLLRAEDGPRIAMVETGGWDTHAAQRGRLAAQAGGLDALLGALKAGLGPIWSETLVLVATEFGRTVAVNGNGGTDHGTGAAAMLLGGAVRGGRVIADWPGLGTGALHEGRDLKPTLGLDLLIGAAVADQFGLDRARVLPALFPGTNGRAPDGLIRP